MIVSSWSAMTSLFDAAMTSAKAKHAPSLVRSSGDEMAFCRIGKISPKMRSPFFLHNSPRVREAVSCWSTSGLPSSDMMSCMRTGRISRVARGVSGMSGVWQSKGGLTVNKRLPDVDTGLPDHSDGVLADNVQSGEDSILSLGTEGFQ